MALDKAIEHGKEKRKPYRGSKAFDCTCRNHGTCEWCKGNREHKLRDKHPVEAEESWCDIEPVGEGVATPEGQNVPVMHE